MRCRRPLQAVIGYQLYACIAVSPGRSTEGGDDRPCRGRAARTGSGPPDPLCHHAYGRAGGVRHRRTRSRADRPCGLDWSPRDCVAGPGRARLLRPDRRLPDRGGLRQAGLWALRPLADTPDARQRPGGAPDGDRPPQARPGRPARSLNGGAGVSLAYAVQHSDGVGRLILYGGFANGHHVASAKLRTAMIELVRAHWGLGSDVLADIFLPDGTAEMKVRFAELQRRSTTAEVAAELLAQCYEIRVDDLLDRVAAPTLVLHRRDDRAIPYRLGRDLAARIPGARLVSLAGRSHWVFAGDAAAVVREILGFLGASHSALPAD